MMNVVLISTSNAGAGRSAALDRMLASVSSVLKQRPDVPLSLLLLLQKWPADLASTQEFPSFVDVSSTPHQVSLSAARNILLSRALSSGLIQPGTMVGFPDDDCWYPQGTLEHIMDQFSRAPALDLWFCRYSAHPVSAAEAGVSSKPARVRDVIRQASSNTMFVRGRIIRAGVMFDEQLGVGTPIGSAEDTEFALRAYILGRQSLHLEAAVVGHRDKNTLLRAKYYRGGVIAMAAHAREQKGIALELVRKVAVGAWLVLRGELSLSGLLGSLSQALAVWRTGKPSLTLPPKGKDLTA